jgi:hypothetical protein
MPTEVYTGAAGFTAGTLDGVVVGGVEPAAATFSSFVVDGDGALPLLQVKDAFVRTATFGDRAHVRTITKGDRAFVSTITFGAGAYVLTGTEGVGAPVHTYTEGVGAHVQTTTLGVGAHVNTGTFGVGAYMHTSTSGINSNIEFEARKSEFAVEALNGISLGLLGPDATTVAYVANPSNAFAVEKSKLGDGATAANIADNRLFAVSGTGMTQMSTNTIALQAGATALARVLITVGDSLITIIDGKDATIGEAYTHELVDGVHGQVRTFSVGAKSGAGTTLVITPTHASFTTVTLNVDTPGECVTLVFTDEWHKISGGAAVV